MHVTPAPARWRPRSRLTVAAVLAVGGLALIASGLTASHGRSLDVGAVPALPHDPAARSVEPTGRGLDGATTSRRRLHEMAGRVPIHSGRLSDLHQARLGPAPVRLSIPSIAVNAHVVAVGIDERSGGVAIPDDVMEAGWYGFGPVPGTPGSAVVVGHVDARTQGPGAFFRLSAVQPGDRVLVVMSDGSSRRFSVVARREYRKPALPRSIFRSSGPAQLVLVTCGGPFDAATRHYRDNVVVYAVP